VSGYENGTLMEPAAGEEIEEGIDWQHIWEFAIVCDKCCPVNGLTECDDKNLNECAGGCEKETEIDPRCIQDREVRLDASKLSDPASFAEPFTSWDKDCKSALDIETRIDLSKSLEKSMRLETAGCDEPTSNVGCCMLSALETLDLTKIVENGGIVDNEKEDEACIVSDLER
jgi:hypothetical protein